MNILQVDNVTKYLGRKRIINDISFSIEEGEIIGLVGPNGAGKTTTIKILTNLIKQNKGTIHICGYDLQKNREKALSCISAIVENPNLYTYMTGKDNINFIRKLNGISIEKMNEVIESIGLSKRIDDKVKKYSLGMKQRLALGMCLLREPKLLILDEPTNGLDPSGTLELRDMIIKYAKESKMSTLISSHNLSEIEKMCDRIIYIKDGSVISIKTNNRIENDQTYKICFKETNKVENLLSECDFIYEFYANNNEYYINLHNSKLYSLLMLLVSNECEFYGIELIDNNVEDYYRDIYKDKERFLK